MHVTIYHGKVHDEKLALCYTLILEKYRKAEQSNPSIPYSYRIHTNSD